MFSRITMLFNLYKAITVTNDPTKFAVEKKMTKVSTRSVFVNGHSR